MKEEIKPCPFCGGKAEMTCDDAAGYMGYTSDYYVSCKKCGATGKYEKSKAKAITAWNKRTSDFSVSLKQQADEIDKLLSDKNKQLPIRDYCRQLEAWLEALKSILKGANNESNN